MKRTVSPSSTFQLLFTKRQQQTNNMNDSVISTLNTELEAILQKNDIEVERLLCNYVRRVYFRRIGKWFLIALAFVCAIYWVPTLNWNATAIARLALIKLVLPFYNWENWANARCLIKADKSSTVHALDEHTIDLNSITSDECSVCENLSKFLVGGFPSPIERLTRYTSLQLVSIDRSAVKSQFWSFAKQLSLAQSSRDYYRFASKLV